ncbi:hypothetical protein HBI26_074900 [Parastagonospora nodorum]|nr:hypothetical protein HBI26_074900 [Parastagonospora nodorum]KAH6140899.1 hypothetical protein HBI64_023070 [Parastagonospora nodorum]
MIICIRKAGSTFTSCICFLCLNSNHKPSTIATMPPTPPTTPPTIAPVLLDEEHCRGVEEDGQPVGDANPEDNDPYAGFVERILKLSSQTPLFALQQSPYSSDPRIPQHRLPSSHGVINQSLSERLSVEPLSLTMPV